MSTAVLTEEFAEASPLGKARAAGALWLTVIAASVVAVVFQSRLVVRDDAALTANNIAASESLFRLSVVVDLFAGACYMGVTVLLYVLLKPAGRSLSLFAAFSGLAGVVVGAAAALLRLAPLVLLGGAGDAAAFTPTQQQALAMTALKLEGSGFNVAMVYFGLQCVSVGYLIVRSTFLPRVLGVLLAVGGASYVLSSFANILSPPVGALLFPFIVPTAIVGEGALTLWLLFKGVNVERWRERAVAS
ncbi:MAG TPA: DUF4386 domain-containing protein [Pyrinomonadaceae bacterium]|nr:DUF4386 domain-containing protein [Pyrinomonadaceae bacterium]